jgi:DNA-binding MarR family transcriptional regulator
MEEGEHPGSSASFPEMLEEQRQSDRSLYRDAEAIEQSLRFIQHATRYAVEDDKRLLPLTPPQLQLLALLARPSYRAGPTLKELSELMGLAHSTVSGIVDRLERQGLVRRVPNPKDRRASNIELTDRVSQYLQQSLPSRRLSPLLRALQQASDEERTTIREGLALLQRLFARSNGQSEGKR